MNNGFVKIRIEIAPLRRQGLIEKEQGYKQESKKKLKMLGKDFKIMYLIKLF